MFQIIKSHLISNKFIFETWLQLLNSLLIIPSSRQSTADSLCRRISPEPSSVSRLLLPFILLQLFHDPLPLPLKPLSLNFDLSHLLCSIMCHFHLSVFDLSQFLGLDVRVLSDHRVSLFFEEAFLFEDGGFHFANLVHVGLLADSNGFAFLGELG